MSMGLTHTLRYPPLTRLSTQAIKLATFISKVMNIDSSSSTASPTSSGGTETTCPLSSGTLEELAAFRCDLRSSLYGLLEDVSGSKV